MATVITDTEVKQGQEGTNVNRADLWLVVEVACTAWSCGLEMDVGQREVSLYFHLNAF